MINLDYCKRKPNTLELDTVCPSLRGSELFEGVKFWGIQTRFLRLKLSGNAHISWPYLITRLLFRYNVASVGNKRRDLSIYRRRSKRLCLLPRFLGTNKVSNALYIIIILLLLPIVKRFCMVLFIYVKKKTHLGLF